MSEITNQIVEVGPLCGCGQSAKHMGMCSVRRIKASATRAANKKLKTTPPVNLDQATPPIDFFLLSVQGDFIRLQLTGKTEAELKAAIVTLANTLGLRVEVK